MLTHAFCKSCKSSLLFLYYRLLNSNFMDYICILKDIYGWNSIFKTNETERFPQLEELRVLRLLLLVKYYYIHTSVETYLFLLIFYLYYSIGFLFFFFVNDFALKVVVNITKYLGDVMARYWLGFISWQKQK